MRAGRSKEAKRLAKFREDQSEEARESTKAKDRERKKLKKKEETEEISFCDISFSTSMISLTSASNRFLNRWRFTVLRAIS